MTNPGGQESLIMEFSEGLNEVISFDDNQHSVLVDQDTMET